MKKVLYLGGFELPDRNAAAHRVISIGKMFRDSGCFVEFIGITHDKNEIGKIYEYDSLQYSSIKYPNGTCEWIKYLCEPIPIDIIKIKNPDVVVLYNYYAYAQNKIIKYCHSNGIKVIGDITEWYQVEGYSPRDLIRRIDISHRMKDSNFKLDGIIAISKYLYDFYKDRVNTVYIPPTVDLNDDKFQRKRLFSAHDGINLIYAGSPGGKQKERLDYVLKSIKNTNKVQLTIVGITETEFRRNYNWNEQIKENVIFLGRINHNQALKVLINSDFQLIIRDDNLVTRAGFPTKFVESFSCGIPVIATPSSNISDYLTDGYNGFLINRKQTFKSCINRLIDLSPEEIVAMKLNTLAMHDFHYTNYITDLNQLI